MGTNVLSFVVVLQTIFTNSFALSISNSTYPTITKCASDSQIEVYRSNLYFCTTMMNVTITVASMMLSIIAIIQLYQQSIINSSSRILIISSIVFATTHQISFLVVKLIIVYQILFKLDQPCDLFFHASECRLIGSGMLAGTAGLTIIQSVMTIDRLIATIFPKFYVTLKSLPAVIISIISGLISLFMWTFLTNGDPLSDYIPNCGYYPPKSLETFMQFLLISAIVSLISSIIIALTLRFNYRISNQYHYNLPISYQLRECFKTTQVLSWLSIAQAIIVAISSGSFYFIRKNRQHMSAFQYSMLLTWIYLPPYIGLFIPIIVIFAIKFMRNQRMRMIQSLTSQKETQDEYMKKIRALWTL